MPLHPEAAAYLERAAALGLPPLTDLTPDQARRQSDGAADALFGAREEVASIEDAEVAGVPVLIYTPDGGAGGPMTVWLHGGGWVVGSIDTHDGVCRVLANRSGCRVASAGYRLAPEHRFPVAVEDSWAVTRWAFDQAPRVAVGGDSAGGGLAAVMALRCRDARLPLAHQSLVYPVTDHSFDTGSYASRAEGFGLTRAGMIWFWDHYLGGADGAHPDASPLRVESLVGVAPALVAVCEYDPLRDEGVAYADRMRQAGVPVTLSEYEGMIHGILRMPAVLDSARRMLDEVSAALAAALRPD
jgi:acetyl esterase